MRPEWKHRYDQIERVVSPEMEHFSHGTSNIEAEQTAVLSALIEKNKNTRFGIEHAFEHIRNPSEFRSRIPVSGYGDYESRLARSEAGHYTSSLVFAYPWSSGTEHARKRIPITLDLVTQFTAAVAPWLGDLCARYPAIREGPAYWIVSPPVSISGDSDDEAADDSIYFTPELGQALGPIVTRPPRASARGGWREWALLTLVHLIMEPDLSWLSVWSPTLLLRLFESYSELRPDISALLRGRRPSHENDALNDAAWSEIRATLEQRPVRRSAALAVVDSAEKNPWQFFWPRLSLCSCWCDGWAGLFLTPLREYLPGVVVQPKGLLATEGVVSIPFADEGSPVLAYTSHFFEFIDRASGDLLLAHELESGAMYEVLMTTGGGLYRYCLNDVVQVDGFFGAVPRVRFMGKSTNVSDMCGEKLSEAHVTGCLLKVAQKHGLDLSGAIVRPVIEQSGRHYEVGLSRHVPAAGTIADDIERAFSENPHYAQCRAIRQLDCVQVVLDGNQPVASPARSTSKETVLVRTPTVRDAEIRGGRSS